MLGVLRTSLLPREPPASGSGRRRVKDSRENKLISFSCALAAWCSSNRHEKDSS